MYYIKHSVYNIQWGDERECKCVHSLCGFYVFIVYMCLSILCVYLIYVLCIFIYYIVDNYE